MWNPSFVGVLTDKYIIGICQRYHLSRDRNFFSFQSVRISSSVISLMMPSADLICSPYQFFILIQFQIFQKRCSDQRMRFQDFFFCRRQWCRFVQNFFIDADFSDIMKRRGCHDHCAFCPGKIIFVRFLDQAFQQNFCDNVDPENMLPAFSVSVAHDLTQNTDHDLVVLLLFINLIRHKRDQSSLFGIKFNCIKYPAVHDLRIKRAVDIIHNSHLIRFPYKCLRVLAGDHDHRNVVDPVLCSHGGQHFEAIHHRHDNVQQYKGNIPLILLQDIHTFFSVLSLQNIKFISENLCKDRTVEF